MPPVDHRTVRAVMTKLVPRAARRCAGHAWRLFACCRAAGAALPHDRSGNVTLIFALAIIPIVGAVAVAVDYSRGNAARTAMQAAPDATTLMVSNEALDLKNAQVRQKAKSYFHAQFGRPDVRGLKLPFDMTTNGPGDFTIAGEATAKMDTALAQVIGYKKMGLRAARCAAASSRWNSRSPPTTPARWLPRTRWSSSRRR